MSEGERERARGRGRERECERGGGDQRGSDREGEVILHLMNAHGTSKLIALVEYIYDEREI